MCTLVVAARIIPEFPLVVVANRDEQKGRASSPPSRWPGFIAPRDEVAGGTWLGLNDHGVFVGITNRFLGPRDASRVSRGSIVVDALAYRSAREIHAAMARLDPARYNGFHLVYADEHDVLATISDGRELAQLTLGDGLSVVTERSFGAEGDAKRASRIRTAWTRIVEGGFDPVRATTLLTEHDPADPLLATCIHLEPIAYGTRSAMVLAMPNAGAGAADATMLWAEGPPCTTPFEKVALACLRRSRA
jgi:uncharacterized protein with NRDE domain